MCLNMCMRMYKYVYLSKSMCMSMSICISVSTMPALIFEGLYFHEFRRILVNS